MVRDLDFPNKKQVTCAYRNALGCSSRQIGMYSPIAKRHQQIAKNAAY